MDGRIVTLQPKTLIGMHMEMSLAHNRTAELWQTFMPRRGAIQHRVSSEYISMQVYGDQDHQKDLFLPTTQFEKWAAVEVSVAEDIPQGMESYSLNGGLYAVFVHTGPAHTFPNTMQDIFRSWLPESGYALDGREHFEVLPEHYNPLDPAATEDVWIPIRKR